MSELHYFITINTIWVRPNYTYNGARSFDTCEREIDSILYQLGRLTDVAYMITCVGKIQSWYAVLSSCICILVWPVLPWASKHGFLSWVQRLGSSCGIYSWVPAMVTHTWVPLLEYTVGFHPWLYPRVPLQCFTAGLYFKLGFLSLALYMSGFHSWAQVLASFLGSTPRLYSKPRLYPWVPPLGSTPGFQIWEVALHGFHPRVI
jgi:hypothetical protein